MATIAILLVGCQNPEEETVQDAESVDESQNESDPADQEEQKTGNNADENSNNKDTNEESSNEDADNDSGTYGGTQETPNYFIDSQIFSSENKFYTAYTIERDHEGDMPLEDRLEESLTENDPSEQDILSSFTDMTVEWPKLQVNFTEEGNQLSATSAQMMLFYDSLFGISDLYGIEEVSFFNPDGEENITVAERLVDEPMQIEDERGLTRGYYTVYDQDLEQTLFLPGGELEEQVTNDNEEPLSFPETVEAMATVDREDAFYSSAMVEGLEVVHASIENGVATVQYTLDEEIVTEDDRTVFENAIQLAALDFNAWEVRLINDTLQEIITYPLVGQ